MTRMACDIRATPTSHGMRLEAFANADVAISGEYHFVITKTGASGSSDITQGGPFDARRGAALTLGSAEVGLERGDHYRAQLTLRNAHGELCRRERQS